MREPQCAWLATFGRCTKMVFTSTSLSDTSRARPTAVELPFTPPSAGSAKVKKMRWLLANCGSSTTSSRPHWPTASTAGKPSSAAEMRPSAVTMRKAPAFSVTSMRPSGRNATAHGWARPAATVTGFSSCAVAPPPHTIAATPKARPAYFIASLIALTITLIASLSSLLKSTFGLDVAPGLSFAQVVRDSSAPSCAPGNSAKNDAAYRREQEAPRDGRGCRTPSAACELERRLLD